MSFIKVENIQKIYNGSEVKTVALKNISFYIKKGEFVSIMGASGSGKSTLLHILGFLDRPSSGKYFFNDRNMDDYNDDELAKVRNKEMGFIFQAFNLLSKTSVYENVKLPLLYSDIKESEKEQKVLDAIEAVALSHRIEHSSSQLSGGEQQRVAIARALIMNPSVIFADEPTGNLDSVASKQVMDIIVSLHKQGRTIVLITHEKLMSEYAQRLIRIKDGLIESDSLIKKK